MFRVEGILVYALYSPHRKTEGPKTKKAFEHIENEIIKQQMLHDNLEWVIVGDWNADLNRQYRRYKGLCRSLGGSILNPIGETFIHRGTGARRKLDNLMSNMKIVT